MMNLDDQDNCMYNLVVSEIFKSLELQEEVDNNIDIVTI